jgi:hypothetical protein
MLEPRSTMSGFVTAIIAGPFLVGSIVATAAIWWLGDWQNYGWGLDLTLRILWGCCIVVLTAAMLTRLTIIGWYFRRYFRPAEQAVPPPDPVGAGTRRPTSAPWYKSGALSFSMTLTLVGMAGATALASAVIWIMGDVFGEWIMWLILKILWGVFWMVCIATVLTRIGVFRLHMLKARPYFPPGHEPAPPVEPTKQPSEQVTAEPPQRSSDQLSLE